MSLRGTLRSNWRVVLLTALLVASTVALFSPTLASPPSAEVAESETTNLNYGLELSGGTRLQAPLVGTTAEGVDLGGDSTTTVTDRVAAELPDASEADVTVRYRTQRTGIVEVTTELSPAELGAALDAAGYEYETVRDGVTETTRQQAVRVLQTKVNEAGLSGGTVQVVQSAGQPFVRVEVPDENSSEVRDLITSRGRVTVQVYHRANGSYTRTVALTGDDFSSVGVAQENPQQGPNVPVAVSDDRAESFQQQLVDTGVAQQGGSDCRYRTAPNSTDPCLLVVVDGAVINAFGMQSRLADSMRSGQWAQDPSFILTTGNFSEAQRVAVNLRAGALPAPMDIGPSGEGSVTFVSAGQGQNYRSSSLITGLVAVFAVSGVVFLRYGRPEVALPMIVTALSEVVILLGFAAAVGYPLDLSVIAGFIAVIGTGVDDLIIIADEVMSEGDVNSRRVFQSRFRKAFWVIGAAAATTVIAMSPLAVLSLGDLKGFAIFTILGVVVGVLVTRPAYGDILRVLLTVDRS